MNVFRSKTALMQRSQAQRIVDKIYPGSRVVTFWESDPTDSSVFLTKEERKMKSFKEFREHCGLKYDVVAHQCGHCNATGYHSDGEKCGVCEGRGTLQTVNDGTEVQEGNDKKVYSREHPEAQKNVKKMQKEDWQSVNRKDKTDGLSQKAVNAYRRENPGSKLQTAVTEKKPKGKRAKRRASFCRRMKGMKSKLTSSKTARDPDSRINKALRRWNCR